VLSAAYGRAARLRRSWYERRPHVRRRLLRPVVSVGNLVVGGSGKTPVVATVARILLASGERPAVLSRGYARRRAADGVVVVSDGARVLEQVERSGDEPQMLARQLPGVPVLVSPDRYLAGRLAERRFDSTVLILDDGFQHLQLARTVDLLLVDPSDLVEPLLPSGRLREPLDAASAAHAVLVAGTAADAARVADALRVPRSFAVTARFGPLHAVSSDGAIAGRTGTVVAVSGIARPARFHAALRAGGWNVAREMSFADHHWFTGRDLARAAAAARDTRADLIVTTEKDAVRVEGLLTRHTDVPWAYLPMDVTIEPVAEFTSWLRNAL
jgi:tetraacyldisaccharide 4'-kinase